MDESDSASRQSHEGDSGIDRARDRLSTEPDEFEALRGSLARAVADAQGAERLLRARQRELDQMRSTVTSGLRTLRDQVELVANSAAWRHGHRAAKALGRVRGRRALTDGGVVAALGQIDRILELLGAPPAPSAGVQATDAAILNRRRHSHGEDVLLGARIRERLGSMPQGERWPPVSVVVVSRSGRLVGGLLDALSETAYPALETILIDNSSPDREVSLVAERGTAPGLSWERIESPASYAAANNRGAELASGDVLLFVNDDIRPIEPGWLRELVRSYGEPGADIVGATLVDPWIAWEPGDDDGYVLEQRGIAVGVADGSFVPIRREAGESVFGGREGTDVEAVAVSAACMLVAKQTFGALGGFDEGYQFGLEDIDLCLRARARGLGVICGGRAVVVHEGSSSRRTAGREFRRINSEVNRRRFQRMWGPAVRRERLTGLLRADSAWGDGPHLAIARTSNDARAGKGDYYTALELGGAAAEMGWRVTYLGLPDEHTPPVPDDVDVAVVLTDRWDVRSFPAQTLLCAWVRNWTNRWLTRPWLDRYDVLLASSERSKQLLVAATGRDVELFPLATNPRRFSPRPLGEAPELDWVFTGNRWGIPRAIEGALNARRRERGAIYGRGWEDVRRLRRLARGSVDYEEMASVYHKARVVLDDTAEPTLAYDALNSRVFDALATGVPVLTNCADGASELFDAEFPTWSSARDLDEQLERLLSDPARRDELGERYRRVVLSEHTYGHRARALRRIVREHNERLSFCLKVGAPDWEQAERWGDLHYARGLGRALRRLGHRWHVEILPEWDSAAGSTFDVTIHLRGRSDYSPAPGQFNVLWLISHPDTFEDTAAEGYDLVCVASQPFAEALRGRVSTPVRLLEQAADPRVFFPDPDPSVAHDLVFVGNSRGVRRKVLDDLLPTTFDLGLYGSGWKGTPAEPHVLREHVPNEELRKIYSSAAIVLCDHWPDMRESGFRSNRLYDALACEALVISDNVAGLGRSLGDAVLTYEEPAELHVMVERLLADPSERARRVAGARARVLASETFDHRARQLVAWILQERARTGAGPFTPSRDAARIA